MYFPWLGLFDQLRLADMYCHYDDVQLSRGFCNRVQLIRQRKSRFVTVPLVKRSQKQLICKSRVSYEKDWIAAHRSNLIESLGKAPFFQHALSIFDEVHKNQATFLHQINRKGILKVAEYLELIEGKTFYDSIDLKTNHTSSHRLLEICKALEAKVYLTGHGALKYLDHELFEQNDVEVFYIKYRFSNYKKDKSEYTPFVSILDPISYLGESAQKSMKSEMVNWRDAMKDPDYLLPKQ